VNAEDFDPFKYLAVQVSDELTDVDQTLLQEGAAVHLLCDLNDLVGEFESDYLQQPLVKRIVSALSAVQGNPIPEAAAIASMAAAGETVLNYQHLALRLTEVYERYVVSRIRSVIAIDA
jgi:hypothetical protein